MSADFVVFEEKIDADIKATSEYEGQTDEISLREDETQTEEKAIPSENRKDREDPEIEYWNLIVANRKEEIARIQKMNEKMEREKTEKTRKLAEKTEEYEKLFELGNEKLNKSREEEEDEEKEEEAL